MNSASIVSKVWSFCTALRDDGEDVGGMDNGFEAARPAGVRHTVFASSPADSGAQSHFGERATTEDDFRHDAKQHAVCKMFNE